MPQMGVPEYPTYWLGFHAHSKILVGNALVVAHDTAYDYAHIAYQNPGADGDSFSQAVYLKKGSYTFEAEGPTVDNEPLVDWYLDGVLVVEGQDWYSHDFAANVRKTATVEVLNSGLHTLKAVVNGKNDSSSGYYLLLVAFSFR